MKVYLHYGSSNDPRLTHETVYRFKSKRMEVRVPNAGYRAVHKDEQGGHYIKLDGHTVKVTLHGEATT